MITQCRYIILAIAGFILWSCSTDKSDYTTLVAEWQGREIKLPVVMTDVLTGDTINLSEADFSILSYVDSAGCTSCKMKLPIWNEFANLLDSISDATVQFIFVVNSNDDKEISYLLKRDSYNYPVFIDSLDEVNSTNAFPSDHTVQTFLLDHSNKVIAIGNPIINKSIMDFYSSIISGKKSLSIIQNAIVDIDHQDLNLGHLHAGDSKMEQFRIKNINNDTIFIRDIQTSCHCTKISVPTLTLLPKSSVECTVKFIGDTVKGEFDNTIYIYYKGFDYPSIIHINGIIN